MQHNENSSQQFSSLHTSRKEKKKPIESLVRRKAKLVRVEELENFHP
jgi:hypothetical protein